MSSVYVRSLQAIRDSGRRSEEGTFSVLETTVANVPLALAVDFQEHRHPEAAQRMKIYASVNTLEELGPMCRINHMVLKKPVSTPLTHHLTMQFALMRKLDLVNFQCAKFMEDGSFTNILTSIEHPKAPINDPKKIKRVQVLYGMTIYTPMGPNQTRVTFASTIKASRFLKMVINIVSTGKQVIKMKETMEGILAEQKGEAYQPIVN